MNAIILAAGLGTRLRPLTNDRPKCMVEVCGTPMVERQIQFLCDIGIKDIILISGYKAEKLNYLKKKYGVKIIFNPKYNIVNNIYSMYVARDLFGDSWVLEGDVFIHRNFLRTDLDQSTYFSVWKESYQQEWGLLSNPNGTLNQIRIGNGQGCIMSGASYWTKEDAHKITAYIEYLISKGEDAYRDLFWDNAVIDKIHELNPIRVQTVEDLYEIDTIEDLKITESIVLKKNQEI